MKLSWSSVIVSVVACALGTPIIAAADYAGPIGVEVISTDLVTGETVSSSEIVTINPNTGNFHLVQAHDDGGVYVSGALDEGPFDGAEKELLNFFGIQNLTQRELVVSVTVKKLYRSAFSQPMVGGTIELIDFDFSAPKAGSTVLKIDDAEVAGTKLLPADFQDDGTGYFVGILGQNLATIPAVNIKQSLGLRFERAMLPDASIVVIGSLQLASTATCSDLNDDKEVDSADLGILLGAYGRGGNAYDLNQDGLIGGADLGLLLGDFGSCQ